MGVHGCKWVFRPGPLMCASERLRLPRVIEDAIGPTRDPDICGGVYR